MVSRLRGTGAYLRALVGRGQSARGFYARRIRYGQLAFDVGANAGQHAEAMVRRGARVIAVEPQPQLAARLGRIPNVTVVQAAVGERVGEAVLHTASPSDGLATLSERWVAVGEADFDGAIPVQVTTLDTLIGRYGVPALMKVDVEGFEDRVLAGLSVPIRHVLFEMHLSLLDVAERALAELERLGRYEYRLMPHVEIRSGGYDPWILGPVIPPEEVLCQGYEWMDIYARRRA